MERKLQKNQEEIQHKTKMIDFISDALDNPAFWLLGGGAVLAEIIGFIISKKSEGLPEFPLWQFLILILGTLVAAAVFANKS